MDVDDRPGQADEKPADAAPAKPRWARWFTWGTLVLAIGALVWTIVGVGPGALWARLILLGPWMAVVVGMEVLITACDAGAIFYFVGRDGGSRARYRDALLAQVAGRAVNQVTPMGGLGEVVKVTLLVERVPRPSRAVASILLYNLVAHFMSMVLIAVGAPLTALLLPVGPALRTVLLVSGGIAAAIAIAIPVLVHRGLLASVVTLGRKIRVVPKRKIDAWKQKLTNVDERLRDGTPERKRERGLGVACLVGSRFLNWGTTAVLVYAAGGPTSLGFLAAVVSAGLVITWIAGVVPMGLGLSEGGNAALFAALGASPVVGVTVALGRRVVQLCYAGIGLVLVAVSQTVQDVRLKHASGKKQGAAPGAVSASPARAPRSLPHPAGTGRSPRA